LAYPDQRGALDGAGGQAGSQTVAARVVMVVVDGSDQAFNRVQMST
jgi:hypothetical protein